MRVLDIAKVQIRVPFLTTPDQNSSEWNQFLKYARQNNIDIFDDVISFWGMEAVQENRQSCFCLGQCDSEQSNKRFLDLGFRPVFKVPDSVLDSIDDGEIVIVGTLYMNNTPVEFNDPFSEPMYEDSAKLEFRQALDNPKEQVTAIKFKNSLFCSRTLLSRISWEDILAQGDF